MEVIVPNSFSTRLSQGIHVGIIFFFFFSFFFLLFCFQKDEEYEWKSNESNNAGTEILHTFSYGYDVFQYSRGWVNGRRKMPFRK